MDYKIDIKLLITLLVMATTLGGFYYTTQLRLDTLEESVAECQSSSDVEKLRKQIRDLSKRLKKMERN